jgi:hypothetical protein
VLTFDRLEPGKLLGEIALQVGADEFAQWDSMFPGSIEASGEFLPPGLVIALMMRGYIDLLGERPKGNVHAGQEFDWGPPAPREGELVVSLSCLRKELKGERRWVWFGNEVRTLGGPVHLRGTMRMLWAA